MCSVLKSFANKERKLSAGRVAGVGPGVARGGSALWAQEASLTPTEERLRSPRPVAEEMSSCRQYSDRLFHIDEYKTKVALWVFMGLCTE